MHQSSGWLVKVSRVSNVQGFELVVWGRAWESVFLQVSRWRGCCLSKGHTLRTTCLEKSSLKKLKFGWLLTFSFIKQAFALWICVYSSPWIRSGILHRGIKRISLSDGKEAGLTCIVPQVGYCINGAQWHTAVKPEVMVLALRETSLWLAEQCDGCHYTKRHDFLWDTSRTSKPRYALRQRSQMKLARGCDTFIERGKVSRRY